MVSALVFSAFAFTAACNRTGDAQPADSSAASLASDSNAASTTSLSLPVAAAPARDGDLVLSVTTTGQVRSDGEATLKAEVAGTISQVLIRPGDRVRRGQSLVVLDSRPFDIAVREAQAAIAESEVRYIDAIAPESLVTKQAPTEERRRNAIARAGLPSARARLERARFDLERATIVAPFDGVVDRLNVAAGERVAAGEAVTTVVNLGDLRIEASVLEHDLPLIKVGGEAMITSAAAPDRPVYGRVAAVLPMVDTTTRAGRAFIRLPPNGILRPGMYTDVRLEATRLSNRRLVPARAIIERDGRPLVFVVKDARAQWVYIQPGRTNGIDTEVLPDSSTGIIPVAPGDEVIVEGHLTLTHDAPVRVLDVSGEAKASKARGARRPASAARP
ncbi:MAG: efflux RND transporter periplasmic adaptor subunit [Cytophagaceae bacterium]|nr:efflux RND transporter periplasmic adaptor subunit [Gemmatimonadaceae bacterium]